MNFKAIIHKDSIVLDNTDATTGKGTVICQAPDPMQNPESYKLWPERRDQLVKLWNDHVYKAEKVYICGPISGLDQAVAYSNFEQAEAKLLRAGYEVINPFKLPHRHKGAWVDYMREDIPQLVQCDTIYLLDGFQHSEGAKIELRLAESLGFKIMTQSPENNRLV
jgi:hypothetical protein